MSLLDKLTEWWKLGEASGNRVGSHASIALASNNGVTQETGKLGSGAGFATASLRYLSAASSASLQFNGTVLCGCLWFKPASVAADQILVGKDTDSPASSRDYTLDVTAGGAARFYWAGGGGTSIVTHSSALSAGNWYFICFKLVKTTATQYTGYLSINGGAFQSSSSTTAPDVSSAEFRVGARQYSGFEGYAAGVIDELALFDQELNDVDLKLLYNEGDGITYEDLADQYELQTGWRPEYFPVRYSGNPIISANVVAWYHSQVFDFNIIEDPTNSANLLMYVTGMAAPVSTGIQTIGLFRGTVASPFSWSEDGGAGNGQVLLPTGGVGDWDKNEVRLCDVLHNPNTSEIWLYYSGSVTRGVDNAIGLAIAPENDPTNFTRYISNPILTADGNGVDDGDFVQQCCVIPPWVSGRSDWVMIYERRPGTNRLRVATSTDGKAWTKADSDALAARMDGENYIGQEYVDYRLLNGFWNLIFESGSTTDNYVIFAAAGRSASGPYYSYHHQGIPILAGTGVVGSFERRHVATPGLFSIGGKQYLFYCGTDSDIPYNGQWSAAVAVYEAGSFVSLATDEFTDTNGTALTSHTMDVGGGWTALTGTFEVQGNVAVPLSNAHDDMIVTDVGESDVVLETTIRLNYSDGSNASSPDLVLRVVDSTHLWLLHFKFDGFELYINDGAGYVLATTSGPQSFTSGVAYRIKVVCRGTAITVFVNEVQRLLWQSDDVHTTATKVGLRTGKVGTPPGLCSWDSFSVQEFQASESVSGFIPHRLLLLLPPDELGEAGGGVSPGGVVTPFYYQHLLAGAA